MTPLQYGFFQNALAAVALVGAACGLLGVYVVHRRLAFVGDALAHATLPGIAAAYLMGISLSVGAGFAAVTAAVLIGFAARRRAVEEDTAVGVVFPGLFALGVLLLTRAKVSRDLTHILFGNVLGVTAGDLWLAVAVLAIVAGTLFALHKELELCGYDPTHAAAMGMNPDRLRGVLLLLLAAVVVAGIQAVGVILTTALLVTPAATASMLSRRLVPQMFLSSLFAAASGVVGLFASYYLEASAGAAVVLAATGWFIAVRIVR